MMLVIVSWKSIAILGAHKQERLEMVEMVAMGAGVIGVIRCDRTGRGFRAEMGSKGGFTMSGMIAGRVFLVPDLLILSTFRGARGILA